MIQKDLTEHFHHYMMNHIPLYDSLIKTITQDYHMNNPVILDIGSGPGILLERVYHNFPQSYLIGLDRSPEMQMTAQNHLKNQPIHLVIGDSEFIPLQHDSVDIIISRFSVCYWNNVQNAVQEIKRILRPNGFGFFQMLNKDFSKFRLMMMKLLMNIHHTPPDVLSYHIDTFKIAYSIDEINNILEESSFRIIQINGTRKEWMYTIIFQKPDKNQA